MRTKLTLAHVTKESRDASAKTAQKKAFPLGHHVVVGEGDNRHARLA